MKSFCLSLLLFCSPLFAQQTSFNPTELLEDAITQEKCVAIAGGVSINGETKWIDSKGFARLADQTKFQTTTKNRIASITKPMTAIAVLQLVEEEKLKLDDPISLFVANLPEASKNITVRHLLGHLSGISAYQSNKEQQNKKEYPTMESAVGIFIDRKLLFEPGTSFSYTSYGYTVLGMVIEKASGMSYEEYLKKNIWNKVGMENTGVEDFGKNYANKSDLYHINSKGKIKIQDPTNLSDRIPGGGVFSTVEDLLKFGNAVLNNELISKETQQLMITDNGFKKEGNPYGLGWYLYGENPKHGFIFGHNGAQTGSSAFLMLLPEQNASVVVLSNTSGAMQTVSNICVQLFNLIDE